MGAQSALEGACGGQAGPCTWQWVASGSCHFTTPAPDPQGGAAPREGQSVLSLNSQVLPPALSPVDGRTGPGWGRPFRRAPLSNDMQMSTCIRICPSHPWFPVFCSGCCCFLHTGPGDLANRSCRAQSVSGSPGAAGRPGKLD